MLLLNVRGVNEVRQIEVHVAEPSAFEVAINSVCQVRLFGAVV
jgi:hypothetical protein